MLRVLCILGAAITLAACGNTVTDGRMDGAAASDAAMSDGGRPTVTDSGRGDGGALIDAPVSAADAGPVDAGAIADAGGSSGCMPAWHPTTCGACGGRDGESSCELVCSADGCTDGHSYGAFCNAAEGTCRCFVDDVEICACSMTRTGSPLSCEAETSGGASCCFDLS